MNRWLLPNASSNCFSCSCTICVWKTDPVSSKTADIFIRLVAPLSVIYGSVQGHIVLVCHWRPMLWLWTWPLSHLSWLGNLWLTSRLDVKSWLHSNVIIKAFYLLFLTLITRIFLCQCNWSLMVNFMAMALTTFCNLTLTLRLIIKLWLCYNNTTITVALKRVSFNSRPMYCPALMWFRFDSKLPYCSSSKYNLTPKMQFAKQRWTKDIENELLLSVIFLTLMTEHVACTWI